MADSDIPTEALEAGEYAALARKRHSQDIRGEERGWLTGDEMEQARAAVRAAAPHLIAEGRRQAAADLRAEVESQSSWLWFELGETALNNVADWLATKGTGRGKG